MTPATSLPSGPVPTPEPVDPRFARPARLCFVIGAQKTGTNWVHRYLASHPDACVPMIKETGYWSRVRPPHRRGGHVEDALRRHRSHGLIRRTADRLLRGRQLAALEMAGRFSEGDAGGTHGVYAGVLFQNWRGQPMVCEVDPKNALLDRATYAEIAALNRDVRFVFILRDPLSRLLSGMRHSLRNRDGGAGVTSAALDRILREALDKDGKTTLAFRRSRYDLTLDELGAAVGPDRIHLFFYETFFTPGEFARFNAALDLSPRPARLDRVSHRGAGKAAKVSPDLLAEAAHRLDPCYTAMRARFGAALPASWHQTLREAAE